MAKLGRLFSEIIITQDNHSISVVNGVPANKMAFDFSPLAKCLAPCDCKITYTKAAGEYSDFLIDLPDNNRIYVLHAYPKHKGDFKTGEVICDKPISLPGGLPDHYHAMIMVNGKWQTLLDYTDRNIPLYWFSVGQKHPPITDWSHYADKQLNISNLPINLTDMATIHNLTTIRMRSDTNLRSDPNTISTVLLVIRIDTEIDLTTVTNVTGEAVNGNETWLRVNYGGKDGWIAEDRIVYINKADQLLQGQIVNLEKLIEQEKEKAAIELAAANLRIDKLSANVNEQAGELSSLRRQNKLLQDDLIDCKSHLPSNESWLQRLVDFFWPKK